jgi:hypothetical protein
MLYTTSKPTANGQLPTGKATLTSGLQVKNIFGQDQNFVTPGTGILYNPSASGRLCGRVSQV